MKFYPFLARNVLAPALDTVRGAHTMRCLAELEESQWWTADRIHELQSTRLQHLIDHAYTHVPYYLETMSEYGILPSAIRELAGKHTFVFSRVASDIESQGG